MPSLTDSFLTPVASPSGAALKTVGADGGDAASPPDGGAGGGGFAGVLGQMTAHWAGSAGSDTPLPMTAQEGSAQGGGRQELAASFALQWAMLTRPAGLDGGPPAEGAGGPAAQASSVAALIVVGDVPAGLPGSETVGGSTGGLLSAAMAEKAVEKAAEKSTERATGKSIDTATIATGEDMGLPIVALNIGPQLSVLTTSPQQGTGSEDDLSDLMAFAREQGFDSQALRLVFGSAAVRAAEGPVAAPPAGVSQWLAMRAAEPASADGPAEEVSTARASSPEPGGTGPVPAQTGELLALHPGLVGAAVPGPAGVETPTGASPITPAVPAPLSGGGDRRPLAGLEGSPGVSAEALAAAMAKATRPGASGRVGSADPAAGAGPMGLQGVAAGGAQATAGVAPTAAVAPQPSSLAAAWAAAQAESGPRVTPATVKALASGSGAAATAGPGVRTADTPQMAGAQWVRALEAMSAQTSLAPVESGLEEALTGLQAGAPATGAAGASSPWASPLMEGTPVATRQAEAPGRPEIGPLDLRAQQDEDRQALANRLGEAVAGRLLAQIERGQWQMRLSVTPDELGPVDIDLKVNGQRVEAQFQVANAQTQSLIQDSVPRLKEAVGASGMDLASVWVSAGGGDRNRGNPTPAQPDDAALAGAAGSPGDDETASPSGVQDLGRSRSSWTPDQGALDILI